MLATALGALALATLHMPPLFSWRIAHLPNLVGLFLFIVVSLLISWLADMVRESRRALQAQLVELESRNREIQRVNDSRARFLARMSHELRTPLNAMVGYTDLLLTESPGPLNDKQRRFVLHGQNAANYLLELTNDILDLTRIDSGMVELRPERFAARPAIEEMVSAIMPAASRKSLDVTVSVDPNLTLLADRLRYKQIVNNLVYNAVKFTQPGGHIWVVAEQSDQGVVTVVRDTGPGIAPEFQEAIFQEFCQGEQRVAAGEKEGVGLGLAITKRLVELHGGTLALKSQLGYGSEFAVTLPRAA